MNPRSLIVRRRKKIVAEVTQHLVLYLGAYPAKDEVLAAYRAGLRQIIMPKSNEKDLRDVPEEVKKKIAFSFVAMMDDVLKLALLSAAHDVTITVEAHADVAVPDTLANLPIVRENSAGVSAGRL